MTQTNLSDPCLVLLAEGFEEIEALTVVDILRRAELDVRALSITSTRRVTGAHGITVEADGLLEDWPEARRAALVVLPGGMPGATNLRDDPRVIELVQRQYEAQDHIGAICAAPIVLERAGITANHRGTSYPAFEEQAKFKAYSEELVVSDDRVTTSRGPATALLFAVELVAQVAGEEKAQALREALLLPQLAKGLATN